MSGWRMILGVMALLLFPVGLWSGPGEGNWHEGVLLSRKTVTVGRTVERTRYVYRLRSAGYQYLVVSDTPLQMGLYVPMKVAAGRKSLIVRDADGQEWKMSILRRFVSRPASSSPFR